MAWIRRPFDKTACARCFWPIGTSESTDGICRSCLEDDGDGDTITEHEAWNSGFESYVEDAA